MNEVVSPKPAHPLATLGGLAGAGVGWEFAEYAGASGRIPIGAAIEKNAKKNAKHIASIHFIPSP